MLSFRFCVLGFLSVSFHPSLLRSHSWSTSACLVTFPFRFFHFSISPFFSAFFRPLLSGFDYSAFRFFFSLLPLPASRWPSRCLLIRVPFRLFPYFRFRFGTQLSCDSFLRSLFRITGATSTSGLLFPARPFPLAFALGSGYLAGMHPEN